jgi:hypothetical protein
VFSPVAKIERSIIKLIFQNFLIEGKVNVSYYYKLKAGFNKILIKIIRT